MKRRITLFILTLIVSGCTEKSKEDHSISDERNNPQEHQESEISKTEPKAIVPQKGVSYNVSADMLLGTWFEDRESNAVLSISSDSIFYVDNVSSYKYDIAVDTLKIHYDGWLFKALILKATEDSLVLMNIGDRSVSYFIK